MVNGKISKAQLKSIEVTIGLLKQLTSEERVVLALYYYENLEATEIATVLQLPEKEIHRRLEHIHAKILDLLRTDNAHESQPRQIAAQAF